MSDPTPTTPITIRDQIIMTAVEALGTLRGVPASDLAQLAAQLAAQRDDLADALFTQTGVRSPYLLLLSGQLDDIASRLDKIQMVLGADPYSSTETGNIRAILLNIMNNAGKIGISPDGTPSDYAQSTGTVSLEGYRYILWGNIAGTTHSDDGIRLTPNTNWDGYKIYIQTDSPSARNHNITTPGASIEPFPVNSWVSLGGSDTLAWSVEASYQARGYIRAPDQNLIVIETVTWGGTHTETGVDWEKYNYGQSTNVGQNTYSKNVFLLASLNGHTLRAGITNSGNVNVTVYANAPETAPYTTYATAPGGEIIITVSGASVYIHGTVGDTFTLTP